MQKTLAAYRRRIDAIDRVLLSQLAKRARISENIGRLKKTRGLNALDAKRLREVLQDRMKKGRAHKLSPDFVRRLFKLIHAESLRIQKKR